MPASLQPSAFEGFDRVTDRGTKTMKKQPILSKIDWVDQCCERLHELDPTMPTWRCHELASAMWDRGECQVMAPAEAADFVFDERIHSGYRDDLE
jgi:hypothetical protein